MTTSQGPPSNLPPRAASAVPALCLTAAAAAGEPAGEGACNLHLPRQVGRRREGVSAADALINLTNVLEHGPSGGAEAEELCLRLLELLAMRDLTQFVFLAPTADGRRVAEGNAQICFK